MQSLSKRDSKVIFDRFTKREEESFTPNKKQLKYLSQSTALEESVHPHIVRFTMLTISFTVFGFIIWASLTKINEVARASGEITPAGFVQTVQQYDGGIVKEIMVKEGQMVKKGQPLITLEGAGANQDLAEAEALQKSLSTEAERLNAVITYADTKDKTQVPDITPDQKLIYDSMIQAHESEKQVVRNQISQRQEAIAVLKSQRGTLARNVQLTQQTYNTYSQLYNQQLLSKVKYIQVQKDLNDYQGELRKVDNQILQAQQEIAEYQSRLVSLEANHIDNARQQLSKLQNEMAQNEEVLKKLRDKVGRLQITSPVDGLVKGLSVNTIGGVVRPGEPLMEIVPIGENLVVEAKIEPKFIGHIKIGQPVQIKVSSYDFSRYGAITGKIDSISAITFTGDKGEKYYRARILMEQKHVGHNPKNNLIMPGMTVEADIITGEKSILAYLLKPIQVSLQTALTEK